ncbi:MAG: AAA family ATPase, partial [Gemmatimonadetes bacterium]|nr:ArsA family ATPase [Gemmatimonadota bacterium]NIQ53985.1 ArsA family ATPase [Gemmatimonadota bacterium]NIU74172.1 AAA family ATPase [Gammaproteobacteria bacterium]NIX44204.1 AAA family ATPase [Gemmatimonadota bacterium]NIY08434.1 AAA family ATPase [Gemmatimonadota bacterium]
MLFFGGKGGVGKTTLAAAWAIRSAEAGDRTLLVSTDPAHSTGDILGRAIESAPTPVLPGLDAMEIDPAEETERYIQDVKNRV